MSAAKISEATGHHLSIQSCGTRSALGSRKAGRCRQGTEMCGVIFHSYSEVILEVAVLVAPHLGVCVCVCACKSRSKGQRCPYHLLRQRSQLLTVGRVCRRTTCEMAANSSHIPHGEATPDSCHSAGIADFAHGFKR